MESLRLKAGAWVRSLLELSIGFTLLAGIVVVIRVVTVSRGDIQVAGLLLSGANFGSILLSTIIQIAPPVSISTATALSIYAGIRIGASIEAPSLQTGVRPLLILVPWGISVALVKIFTPAGLVWTVYTQVLLLVVVAAAAIFLPRRHRGPSRTSERVSRAASAEAKAASLIGLLGLAIVVFVAAAELRPGNLDTAWTPTEALSFKNQEPLVGSIIGQQGDYLTIVVDNPREFFVVNASNVTARWVCRSPNLQDGLLDGWRIGTVKTRYIRCSDALESMKADYKAHRTPPETAFTS